MTAPAPTHFGPSPYMPGDTLHAGPQDTCTAPDCADRAATADTGTLRALTIQQPWADAIVHVDHPKWGRKRIENRSWPAPAALLGTRILIHAGKATDRQAVLAGILPGPDVRGAVIGTALLKSCHSASVACGLLGCGPWAHRDVYHWVLDDVVALTEPVPAKGSQRLWKPTPDLVRSVRAHTPPAENPRST